MTMPLVSELPSWVRVGAVVVELSQTRGIVLSRIKIDEITPTEIVVWGGNRYRIGSMTVDVAGEVVFCRQNPYLPLCNIRLASPTHPDAR